MVSAYWQLVLDVKLAKFYTDIATALSKMVNNLNNINFFVI